MLMAPWTLVLVVCTGFELVVNRRRRAGEIINLVDFDIEGKADIVSNKLESGIQHETGHIRPCRREEVIHAEDLVPAAQQSLTQMGTDESSPPAPPWRRTPVRCRTGCERECLAG